jgi:D-aminopeptidase
MPRAFAAVALVRRLRASALALGIALALAAPAAAVPPQRARDLGVAPGIFKPGAQNAITDVAGVRVGHTTLIEGEWVRTGVTAVLPHAGNMFTERVPAAIHVANGFGKLLGSTQVAELGELETPILLTCTLCVWKAADALVAWMLEQPGLANVRSLNPVVAETNDGRLNAIRSRPLPSQAVRIALQSASTGPVREGSVGAGTGTVAFGFKGGIGTSSRVLPAPLGGHTVGVLVQSNFGGVLQVLGVPVGKELGQYAFREATDERGDGSIVVVVATDAPLSDRNLGRLAARAMLGVARTGSSASNGSGDYVIAFSTAESVRRRVAAPAGPSDAGSATRVGSPTDAGSATRVAQDLDNDAASALFQAVIEATEEAVYNSLFMATPVSSRVGKADPIPLDRVREILKKYNVGR